ncbi:MAG: EAL domain-containing protein, partial [Gammaproteobacteria bacterium]|nr:EAL domain-containing protein [Gammaproteobacteria bacterium]
TKTIHMVINRFLQAKRMLDSDYLKQLTESVNKIKNASYNKNQQAYIDTLLIHVNFLNENYPLYIKVFSEIMNSPLRNSLEKTQQQFNILAEDDFTYLNTLAISLFILIFLALLGISILLFYLKKDNKKLLMLHDKLNFTLQHDSLTGLLNRNSYDAFVSQQEQPIILLINISKFKNINDFYGADIADKFLIEFSQRILTQFKHHSASCFRISGDEFTIVFTEKKQTIEDITLIAQQLNKHLTEKSYNIANIKHTISINMAISDQKPLLETADMVLKEIKLKPRINILHYSEQYNIKEQLHNNIKMTQILHDALNDNRIIPYFQPIIDLKTREIVKYEALVRLKLKDDTILPPIKFLPIAQKTPLYYEITRIMISKTIAYFSDKPYRFSINFSMTDFENDEIIKILLGQFSAYPEVVTRLDIEILESEKLTDMNRVKHFISELKKLGCGISIDDFGSGYSNFTNLTELDLDILKIDGSLIKEITESTEHYKTVKAIMGLVNEMGIESIAEFVQDESSAQLLTKMGVTHAQGYYFGKPDAEIIEL